MTVGGGASTPALDVADLRICGIRALRGPNYWRLAPVIACDVRLGSLEQVSSSQIPGLPEKLVGLLPSLREHPCTKGHPGGFVERLEEGTYLPHILEHIALELQTLAGADVTFGRVVASGDPGVWWVIVSYEDEAVGVRSLEEAGRLLRACIAGEEFDAGGLNAELRELRDVVSLGPSTRAIHDEATRRGIPVRRLNSRSLLQLGLGRRLRRIQSTVTDHTSAIGVDIARNKEETKRVLGNIGLPVPSGATASSVAEAVAIAEDIGFPVILKPLDASQGRGISPRLESEQALRDAWSYASRFGRYVLVEKFTPGRDHRVLVVNGKVVAAAERIPSTGGTAIDRTQDIHPDNVTACEMAAGVMGLDIAGIDIVTADISVPLRENEAVIIGVNAGPGVRMHTQPDEGEPRNVGAPILDMLFPPGVPTTIPVIAVTGTNGKTTTVRLIAHLFRNTGKTVGFTTTDGVYLQNRLVREGDMTGPFAANIVLSNPTVDVAVLETARGGILRAGLGFDECDVAVVLNVAGDHLGHRGINTLEQLADVKAVVPSVVKREGHAILNADDPLVHAMRDKSGGDIVLFSLVEPGANPAFEKHVAKNGIAARIEDGEFVIRRGRLRIPVARVRDVPLMLGGAARFQRGNILAAILAAYVQGMRYDDIRAGLLSFSPSPTSTPGRLNLTRVGSVRVLVDYAHNPSAIEGLLELVNDLPARRRIGVIATPGDRRDEDIRAVGRLCSSLDRVILKEDADLRGRARGEIVELMREGLHEAGMGDGSIEGVSDEIEALLRALETAEGDDLVIVLAENVPAVLACIDSAAAPASSRA